MINYDKLRYPIVIIGTARSGTTALAKHIEFKLKTVKLFDEPEHDAGLLNELKIFSSRSNKYIIKTHANHLELFPAEIQNYLKKDSEPYRIRIFRNDLLKQAMSLYLEFYRNKWYYFDGDAFKKDVVPINNKKIERAIAACHFQRDILEKLDISFDETLIYEDCSFENTGMMITPKPKNFDDLSTQFNKIYTQYKNS